MTLPIYASLADYWRDFPPVHELFAAFVGVTPHKKSGGHDPEEWKKFTAQFAGMPGARPALKSDAR